MALKILVLDGLTDVKLCKLVSTLIDSVPGVDYANIDYLSQRLTLQLSGRDNMKTIAKVILILKENMPSVTVRFADDKPTTPEKEKPNDKGREKEKPPIRQGSGRSDSTPIGSPSNVASTISTMIKDDTSELARKKARENERALEEQKERRRQAANGTGNANSTGNPQAAATSNSKGSLAELLPQSSALLGKSANGAKVANVANEVAEASNDSNANKLDDYAEDLPDNLSEDYTWEIVDSELVKQEDGEAENIVEDADAPPSPPEIPFFDRVREHMSVEIFWQLCGAAGGVLSLLIAICFPQEHPANYIFSTVSFIVLAIFALLVDTGENRGLQIMSSIIMTFGCATLFFTGGSRSEACSGLIFYHIGITSVYFINRWYRQNLENVISIRPKTLIRIRDEIRETIPFSDLQPTDEIVIEKGQCIPFDGIVVNGEGHVDESFINGVKEPRTVLEGGQVECGTYNVGDTIRIVMISLPETTAAGIIRKSLLEDNPKGNRISQQTQRFQFLAAFIQLIICCGVFALYLFGQEYEKCLSFLPVALILLSPLSVATVVEQIQTSLLARAIKSGIILTSSNKFDEIMGIKTLVTGCSGVLTDGLPVVDSIIAEPEQHLEDISRAAAYSEYGVDHPIAKAIIDYYTTTYKKPVLSTTTSVSEPMTGGIRAVTDAGMIMSGGEHFMELGRISVTPNDMGHLTIYIARYGEYVGRIIMREKFNTGFSGMGNSLKSAGLENVILLTGRDRHVAEEIGRRGGFSRISYEHTAESKRNQMLLLIKGSGIITEIAYVGLIDDVANVLDFCPCIAMGKGAMEIMLNSAKAVIPTQSPQKLVQLFKLAQFSRISGRVIAISSLCLNLIVLVFAAFGAFSFLGVAIYLLLLSLGQAFYGYLHLGE